MTPLANVFCLAKVVVTAAAVFFAEAGLRGVRLAAALVLAAFFRPVDLEALFLAVDLRLAPCVGAGRARDLLPARRLVLAAFPPDFAGLDLRADRAAVSRFPEADMDRSARRDFVLVLRDRGADFLVVRCLPF